MSILFTPVRFNGLEIKNRFVHSATYEVMAALGGEVTDRLIHRYEMLSRGGTGLVIPGYMFVTPEGRSMKYQTGIHSDTMIDGLSRLADSIHERGAKVVFQLNHGGRQVHKSITGRQSLSPSRTIPDPVFLTAGHTMKEEEIWRSIEAFKDAAARAVKAGADGIQLHAANGFLLNQFLSPFFNRRKDQWGGDASGRFRYFAEVYKAVRSVLPGSMPVLVKLNMDEHLPFGIKPGLAVRYAAEMAELGIDGLEPAEGTISFNNFNIWRGNVPVPEMVSSLALWKKPAGWVMMKAMKGRYDLTHGYALETASGAKAAMGTVPLMTGGGFRDLQAMERAVTSGRADVISLSRPFIREPFLVKKFEKIQSGQTACISCNRCVAAVNADIPLSCCAKGLPARKSKGAVV